MNDLTQNPKVRALHAPKPVYCYESSDQSQSLEFDQRYLYERWDNRTQHGTKAYLLHDLSPKLSHCRQIGENSISTLKQAALMLGLAIVFYFSDIQLQIPLLAPGLFLVSLGFLIRGLIDLRPRSWTYIYDDDGNFITSIPIDPNESHTRQQQRLTFETHLSQSIELAKQQEYYNWE